jgi:hypothetical protein
MIIAGCSQLQLGAAALYGSQRITSAKLSAEASNLTAAYTTYQSKLRISYRPVEIPARALSWMLRFAIVDRLADQQHIAVTPHEAGVALGGAKASLKQSGLTLSEFAVLVGLPPDMLNPGLGYWIAIQNKLESKIAGGTLPTTPAGQQAATLQLAHLECLAAKSLDIKVNPQYGVFDYGRTGLSSGTAVVFARSTLAAAPTGVRQLPVASPQLTPRC